MRHCLVHCKAWNADAYYRANAVESLNRSVHPEYVEVGGCLMFRVSGLDSLLAFGPFDWATKRAVSFIHKLALSIPLGPDAK